MTSTNSSTRTAERQIRRIEMACEAAFAVAAETGTATCATVAWETAETCGIRVDFADGQVGVAEVWWDDDEFAWVVEWNK